MRIAAAALIAVLLAAAWSAGWFYAAHEAGRQLDGWLKSEATVGRDWTCPKREIGGYPVAITVSCRDATFSGRGLGQNVAGSVAHVIAGVSILHPASVTVDMEPPLSYRTLDGDTRLTAEWKALRIVIDGISTAREVSLDGRDIALRGSFGQAGEQHGEASNLDAVFTPSGPSHALLAYAIGVRAAKVPFLDTLLGGRTPINIDLRGQVDHTNIDEARTPDEAAEKWRRAGGSVEFADAQLRRGETHIKAHGNLRLDDGHRLEGKLDTQLVGLGPILQRFGISGNLAAIGSLLSHVFGAQPSRSASEPGAINLPVRFQKGHLTIGPIVTQVQLLPLY